MMTQFMSRKSAGESHPAVEDITLTRRETEIIRLIAEELTNSEIGDKLGISTRTVDTHRRNLLQKIRCEKHSGIS